jgi:sigma-B regulation protein RsbU (phosphoserine phosphatase)
MEDKLVEAIQERPVSVKDDWQKRLHLVVETMREMSGQTDPQAMVAAYSARMRKLLPTSRMVTVSRRFTEPPHYHITRSSLWKESINPWKDKHKLPLLSGGLLGELLYGDVPRQIDELNVSAHDPAAEYFAGQGSLIALPLYDQGAALNMVILMREAAHAFDREEFPEWVWTSNLFGRATTNLVLKQELQVAYDEVDRELKAVEAIQRSLLPEALPKIPTMDLAAHYQTSHRAGGDYYDFFPLPDGKWGILIADVSGHGTPAAVMMAITHSLAHTLPGPPTPPCNMLCYLNEQLCRRYTGQSGSFVTAFYGIYDPATRTLSYSSAGHNPPRLKHCDDGTMSSLDGAGRLPLGIFAEEEYEQASQRLRPGDQIIFYTDGITEAQNARGEMFGTERLDHVLEACRPGAKPLIDATLEALELFTAGRPADDDRTILVAKIS